MVIHCNYCQAFIDVEPVGEAEEHDPEEPGPVKIVLIKCPKCKNVLVGHSYFLEVSYERFEWTALTRLWPHPENAIHWSIPPEVRDSLQEAKTCFHAGAFDACAVMCGKALEAMCLIHTQDPRKTLAEGLKTLKKAGIIDSRLFEWSESLRTERNTGAHAGKTKVGNRDAKDVLDFALAICEYVYVLADRYEEYKKRKQEGINQT